MPGKQLAGTLIAGDSSDLAKEIGLVMAAGLTQLLKAQLPALSPTRGTDPLTYVGVTVVCLLVAILASFVPARRAMRVEPIVTLRVRTRSMAVEFALSRSVNTISSPGRAVSIPWPS